MGGCEVERSSMSELQVGLGRSQLMARKNYLKKNSGKRDIFFHKFCKLFSIVGLNGIA